MKVIPFQNVEEEQAEQGAHNVTVRWLITQEDGAENFAMRHFQIAPGGYTPFHSHDWEHGVFILQGKGKVRIENREWGIHEGDVIFIPANTEHQFQNMTRDPVRFICLIPYK